MFSTIAILFGYLIIGFIHDVGTTMWYISIEARKTSISGFISTCLSLMSYGVIAYMVLSPDFLSRIIAYSLGAGIGTSLTVHFRYNGNYKIVTNFFQKYLKRK